MNTMQQIILLILLMWPAKSLSECPRTPSPSGYPAPVQKLEVGCALQCKAAVDCISYMYKPFDDFIVGPNSFSSNCMLQTVYDRNFMSEELLNPTEYKSKVGVVLASDSQSMVRFIDIPNINVSENAYEAGFTFRVEFPDQKIAKFYKILNGTVITSGYRKWSSIYYWHRICAAHGGLIATPYTPGMAKILHTAVNSGDPGMAVGLVLRSFPATNGDQTGARAYVHVSGKIDQGNTPATPGTCDAFSSVSYTFSGAITTLTYSSTSTRWELPGVTFATNPDIKAVVCEFQGSKNWAASASIAATTFYDSNWKINLAMDGNWNLPANNYISAYVSKIDVPSFVQVSLPVTIALKQVSILPRTDAWGHTFTNPIVLVSQNAQGKSFLPNSPAKIKMISLADVASGHIDFSLAHKCGQFKVGFAAVGDVVSSIECERFLPIGKFVLFHEPYAESTHISELAFYGLPIDINS